MKRQKRNPQDTTLRNTRAANKRLDKLEKLCARLEKRVGLLSEATDLLAAEVGSRSRRNRL